MKTQYSESVDRIIYSHLVDGFTVADWEALAEAAKDQAEAAKEANDAVTEAS